MISKLTGIIDEISEDSLTIDVGGVGYLVYIPKGFFIESSNDNITSVYIQTLVKEDAISLYGFKNSIQRQVFNLLISVQGVGAKVALLIISQLSIEEIQQAILFENTNILKSINGIGVKVAQRLVTELRDKISKITLLNPIESNQSQISKTILSSHINEAIKALEGLGYSSFQINKVVKQVSQSSSLELTSEELIRECLIYMAKELEQ